MAVDKIHHDCSARVYGVGASRAHGCSKPGTVERPVKRTAYLEPVKLYNEETFDFTEVRLEPKQVVEPRWFCGSHDPVAVEAREQKRRDAQETAWRMKQAREFQRVLVDESAAKLRQDVIDAARELVAAKFEAAHPAFEKLVSAVNALEAK